MTRKQVEDILIKEGKDVRLCLWMVTELTPTQCENLSVKKAREKVLEVFDRDPESVLDYFEIYE